MSEDQRKILRAIVDTIDELAIRLASNTKVSGTLRIGMQETITITLEKGPRS